MAIDGWDELFFFQIQWLLNLFGFHFLIRVDNEFRYFFVLSVVTWWILRFVISQLDFGSMMKIVNNWSNIWFRKNLFCLNIYCSYFHCSTSRSSRTWDRTYCGYLNNHKLLARAELGRFEKGRGKDWHPKLLELCSPFKAYIVNWWLWLNLRREISWLNFTFCFILV